MASQLHRGPVDKQSWRGPRNRGGGGAKRKLSRFLVDPPLLDNPSTSEHHHHTYNYWSLQLMVLINIYFKPWGPPEPRGPVDFVHVGYMVVTPLIVDHIARPYRLGETLCNSVKLCETRRNSAKLDETRRNSA